MSRTFKIYPTRGDKTHHFLCLVKRSKAEMYQSFRRYSMRYKGKFKDACTEIEPLNFRALVSSVHVVLVGRDGGVSLRPGRVGTIFFYRGRGDRGFDAETVSHEMTHAAVHYWAITKRNPGAIFKEMRFEESFCESQGYMVRQFWDHYWNKIRKKS